MPYTPNVISSGSVALTSHVSANLAAIETFLSAGVETGDVNDFDQSSVPRGELISHFGFAGSDALPIVSLPKAPEGALHDLDSDGQIDFHVLPLQHINARELSGALTESEFYGKVLNEKMGSVPEPSGHAYNLNRCPFSWNDWRWALDEPASYTAAFTDDPGPDPRRPVGEYWTTWKTVPGCSDRIYVPSAGIVHVTGWARGTFNAAVRNDAFSKASGVIDFAHPAGDFTVTLNPVYARANVPPVEFRLFVEAPVGKVEFDWEANGRAFGASWAPLGPEEVALVLGDSGFMIPSGQYAEVQSWPRADVLLHSWFIAPAAGWYTIAMKCNTRYWYGYDDEEGAFVKGFYKITESYDNAADTIPEAIGPLVLCRWEGARISALFQANRTAPQDTATGGDFNAP